jgi:SAM-dependent methyltransferase
MEVIMSDMAGAEAESALDRAERVYSSAADHFTRPALAFWDVYGAETVRRTGMGAGDHVLDLCCGAGASVLPAARAVGETGSVTGVDITAPLLAQARERVEAAGLGNVELVRADATATGFDDASFDAVVCVFGVFFVDDMPAFVAEMWRMVRPGGALAVTTWGPGVWEPASSVFWRGVRDLRPELYRSFNPWDEITTTDALVALLAAGGVDGAVAEAITGSQSLECPEDFWDVVLGSGYRGTVDALDDDERESLRAAVVEGTRREQIADIRTDVVIAVATKPLT